MGRLVAEQLRRSPRQLPAYLLYDQLGSALFDAICRLPWYNIARVEQQLLEAHGADVFAHVAATTVVELGPGSGEKLVTLLRARSASPTTVHLVDVSAQAISRATRTLNELPDVVVRMHHATYEEGLRDVRLEEDSESALVAFLGSNIGNFDPEGAVGLLRAIRDAIRPGDALLLGTDLVKPEAELLEAYDDPLGVTAAFNRNLLVRLNRELGADFRLDGFTHRAVWNDAAARVEMHLVSAAHQRVVIPGEGDLTFEPGDAIWTESSYKYRVDDLNPMLGQAGFEVIGQWSRDGFALTLARAA